MSDDGINVVTFAKSDDSNPEDIMLLNQELSKLKLSRPTLLWRHPLNVKHMTRDEVIRLRDILNSYLDGKFKV